MNIGFDIHGVLSDREHIIDIVRKLYKDGHFLYVISGKPAHEMRQELLRDYGYTMSDLCMFTECYSIVDHIRQQHPDTKIWVEGDNWWVVPEDYWWDAKAEIAERIGLDVLIDDNINYRRGYLEFRLSEYKVFMSHPNPTDPEWLERSCAWPRYYPKLTPKTEVPVRVVTQEDWDQLEQQREHLHKMLTMPVKFGNFKNKL